MDALRSHGYVSGIAQVPTPCVKGNILEVFISSRNTNNQSYVSKVTLADNFAITEVQNQIFDKSKKAGTFDDEGVMPSQIINEGGKTYMTYTGWNSRNTVPYHNATGLAVLEESGEWERVYEGPILDRIHTEPYLAVTPWLKKIKGKFEMLYSCGTGYTLINGKQEPLYTLKFAESIDLLSWNRQFEPVINNEEFQDLCINNPSFLRIDSNHWLVLACARKASDYHDGEGSYRLIGGVSSSLRKINNIEYLTIANDPVMGRNKHFFNSMQAYPSLFKYNSIIYCLFNGNSFGRTGFGIARVEVR